MSYPMASIQAAVGSRTARRGIYEKVLTISNGGTSDLVDYQVWVNLTAANWDFAKTTANGSDIRIYDGNTLVPHFVLAYNPATTIGTLAVKTSVTAGGSKVLTIRAGVTSDVNLPVPLTYTRATSAVMTGLAEDMVYDPATNKYYVVYCVGTDGPVALASADAPTGPWTDEGTILAVSAGQWDSFAVYAPCLFLHEGTWYLYYSGGPVGENSHAIGYATATSITGPYTKYASNPVITYSGLEDWERYRACEPYVYYSSILSKWICLYMGDAGSGSTQVETVGYAVADAPTGPWTKYGSNPVIPYGAAGEWDAGTVADPFAVEIGGVAYIGYTGSPTSSYPWTQGFVKTTDYITFTRISRIDLGDTNSTGSWEGSTYFRGALLKVSDTWYLTYTGFKAGAFNWAVASAPVALGATGFDPKYIFDLYESFDKPTLDGIIWTSGGTGTPTIANSVLTMATSGNYTILAKKTWLPGSMLIAKSRHPNALGNGSTAGEIGFSDVNRAKFVRIYDYNTAYWIKGVQGTGAASSDMAQAISTNWVVQTVKWLAAEAKFQNDAGAEESIATNIPGTALPPWMFLFSTGAAVELLIDWILVCKCAAVEPTAVIS